MKFLVVLPDSDYFLWQMLVQINNFRKLDYEKDVIYVIGKNSHKLSDTLLNIMNSDIKSEFHVINDTRKNPQYSSSLRPHILAKLFNNNPKMEKESFLYIDPDVLFTKKIRWGDLEKNDIWYLSDTRSYIDSKYIKGKADKLFIEMCDIVGVKPEIVEKNDKNAGGAQYLMKNVTSKYWEKVEKDSENLFKHMVNTSNEYNPKHPIQSWTSDMWAVLWNAWLFGYETKISKRMDFSWATDLIKKWDVNSIHHNAGAMGDDDTFFVKTKHQISPFNKKLKANKKYCSFNYIKEIKNTEKNFKSILF